ncbi:MAG: zinc-dependent metalloprotease [Phycisphaerales bacterium JB059]
MARLVIDNRITPRVLAGVVGAALGLSPVAQAFEPPAETPAEQGETELDLAQIQAMMGNMGARRGSDKKQEFKPWKEVSEGFEQVVSTADGSSFYGIWINKKNNQMLAELPRGFERQKHFFAMTVAGGEIFAGLQAGDLYTYWKRFDDELALILPQIGVRSNGDQESKDSVKRIFTDRVLLSVPIIAIGPNGQPVIDMDNLLVNQASKFFGSSARGVQANLATIDKAKAFPQNVEIAYKVPVGNGSFKTFFYSISNIKGTPGYKPRKADERVGYFTTSYRDLGQIKREKVPVRYINRWHLEKRDPKLKMSPPQEPIVWYVEHTAPVRYRRFIRQGVEYWNKAFEQVGIVDAMEVRFQDKASGAHMDKDPEDVRYNFIRWLSNDISTAIGPSRVNPMTGEILDADVVLTDGWMRVYQYWWNELMPELATEGYSPQMLSWLEKHPRWDPRLRMASPDRRDQILAERAMRGVLPFAGHPAAMADPTLIGDDEYDGLHGRTSQVAGACHASHGKGLSLAMARMHLELMRDLDFEAGQKGASESAEGAQPEPEITPEMLEMIKKQLEQNPALIAMVPEEYRHLLEEGAEPEDEEEVAEEDQTEKKGEKKKEEVVEEDLLDGVPEEFIGPMLAELVAHEVGHCIGLRHNFKGSSAYTLDEINSEEMKGVKPWSTTVMDYNPVNIRVAEYGDVQGDWAIIDIGPYDMWAIEYGYTSGKLEPILARVAEPELQYGTDEDTWGPDPYARRYDMSKNPLDYAKNQMALAQLHREQLIDKFVKDGQSWSRARRGYLITLSQQTQALSMMSNWLGGAHVYRDKKGDPNGRAPIDVVDAETQREALKFVIDNSFKDEAFGLSPEILNHMTVDKWWDQDGMGSIFEDPTFPIHERVLAIQSSAMTMLLNPFTLGRVLDNEAFVPADQDALTLPEVMKTVTAAAWSELDSSPDRRYTSRDPMISSFRRNLQKEHIERLIDLTLDDDTAAASQKPIANLARMHLRDIKKKVDGVLGNGGSGRLDDYTRAHLEEASVRIDKALDAHYIANMIDGAPTINLGSLFGAQPQDD